MLELQELHNAESQLSRALPRLMKSAESEGTPQSRAQEERNVVRTMERALEEGESLDEELTAGSVEPLREERGPMRFRLVRFTWRETCALQ